MEETGNLKQSETSTGRAPGDSRPEDTHTHKPRLCFVQWFRAIPIRRVEDAEDSIIHVNVHRVREGDALQTLLHVVRGHASRCVAARRPTVIVAVVYLRGKDAVVRFAWQGRP